jgi:hypothetical protein
MNWKNPNKRKEYNLEYYKKNKEELLAKRFIQYRENIEQAKERRKMYRERYKGYDTTYNATANRKFTDYKSQAKKRGFSFELNFEFFNRLLNLPCHYCGSKKAWGVDRVDSDYGYLKTNVVSCCRVCNNFKMALSKVDFLQKVQEIYLHSVMTGRLNSFKTSVSPQMGQVGMVGEQPTGALSGLTK